MDIRVQIATLVAALFLSANSHAMQTGAEGYDKYITQIIIVGTGLPQFQRIFIMPYTEGPLMQIQEAPGLTINGVQDYAVKQMQTKRWKAPQPLVIKLSKPMLINITSDNPACLVAIEPLKGQKFEKATWDFGEDEIHEFAKFNDLIINHSAEGIEVAVHPS